MFWFCFVWILNALISWWNATAVGRSWKETKAVGGWPRVMAWSGAVMSACGFSWCLLILLTLAGHQISPTNITDRVMSGSMAVGFIILGPVIVLSGLAIWLDSWKRAFRQGGFMNYGVAVYNTYAQLQNTVSVVQGIGQAGATAGELFKGSGRSGSKSSGGSASDAKDIAFLIVLALVAVSLLGGTLLTYYIIRTTSRTEELPWAVRDQLAQAQKHFATRGQVQHA